VKKMFHFLENVNNVNSFYRVKQFTHVNGVQQNVYFRLIQKQDGTCESQDELRYIPGAGSTVTITFDCLDQSMQILRRAAIQPFPNDDRSIWMVVLLSTDVVTGAGLLVNISDPTVNHGLPEAVLPDSRLISQSATSSRYFG
jgi:hypothetical protein